MKSLSHYRIPFTGLKTGKHSFEFEVDDLFFAEFEYSLVKNGKLKVNLEFDKQETMILLLFRIVGEVFSSCDVCLANYPYLVDITERQIVKFGEIDEEDDQDEIILLGRNENELDVSTLIYEYINLSVPYINRCAEEGNTEWCDSDMIQKLNELSVRDKQEENEIADDPRWEALKKIKNN